MALADQQRKVRAELVAQRATEARTLAGYRSRRPLRPPLVGL